MTTTCHGCEQPGAEPYNWADGNAYHQDCGELAMEALAEDRYYDGRYPK